MTRKQQDAKFNKRMEIARGWFSKGFDADTIADGVWNKFGLPVEAISETEIRVSRQIKIGSSRSTIVIVSLV